MALPILFEDSYLTIAIKPAGVLSEEGGMPELLAEQLHAPRMFCVHRLDRAVGGVMVYAKDGKAAARLSEMIAGHEVNKEYLAAVHGAPQPAAGEMRDLLFHDNGRNKSFVVARPRRGVKEAALAYWTLETASWDGFPAALVRVRLQTGRSHQIRVQFASRQMPLIGDGKYGSSVKNTAIALWSHRLCFPHPFTGADLDFSAPPPALTPWTCFSTLAKGENPP